jgi:hypothetical protein
MAVILNGISNFAVPAADSAANVVWGDVTGSKSDSVLGNSLYALGLKAAAPSVSARYVYPTLAAGATVVSAAADWTYGEYATVVPASTVTAVFHIDSVSIESCSDNAVYELQLYSGATDTAIAAIRFAVAGGFFGNQVYHIGSSEIAANAQVRARLASSDGAAHQGTITISVVYWQFV